MFKLLTVGLSLATSLFNQLVQVVIPPQRVLIGQTNTLKCRISFGTLIRYSETISKRTIDGHCLLNQLILVNYKSNTLMIYWGMGK